jgi:hypothetical protein
MAKGRDKRKRKAKKESQRTGKKSSGAYADFLKALFEEQLAALPGSDSPPILGEPDARVRAPLRPKPHIRSGAIAVPEPEPEDAFLTVNPRPTSTK